MLKLSMALAAVFVASLSLDTVAAAQNTLVMEMSAKQKAQKQKAAKQSAKGSQRKLAKQTKIQHKQSKVQKRKIEQPKTTQQPKVVEHRKLSKPMKFGHVKVRGAEKVMVAGKNYSVWRGGHRVHRHGYWRTFVGLSALSAIMLGSAYYYPYAYIDAPGPYCAGLTEDGCQLQWEAVPTIEGPTEYACVAYCPWR